MDELLETAPSEKFRVYIVVLTTPKAAQQRTLKAGWPKAGKVVQPR